jgi:hypothetical protein
VGIGTNSPGDELHVSGDLTLEDNIPVLSFEDSGATTAGGLSFNNNNTYYGGLTYVLSANRLRYRGASTFGSFGISSGSATNGSVELALLSTIDDANNFRLEHNGYDEKLYLYSREDSVDYGPHLTLLRQTGEVGLGTASPLVPLDLVYVSSGTGDGIRINNEGSGDAVLRWAINNSTKFTAGVDNSDADKFKIGSGTNVSTNTIMTMTSASRVGIGTTSPLNTLHVNGGIKHDYPSTSGNALNAAGSSYNAFYYIDNSNAGNGWGLYATMSSASATANSFGIQGSNYGSGYGVYGYADLSTGTAVYGVNSDSDNYGHIGGSEYGVMGELVTGTPEDYGVYGGGANTISEAGTGYLYGQSIGGVKGLNMYGSEYNYAVAGYNNAYASEYRQASVFGCLVAGSTTWGALMYYATSGSLYGGYFTSYTTGTGEAASEPKTGIGIGSWGEFIGADIHGGIYGIYAEGKDYAMFSNGTVYKNDLDVHLQRGKNNQQEVLYTHVSTDATVMTSGVGQMANGKSKMIFDETFREILSEEDVVVVTVTPLGKCNGIFLSSSDLQGFTVEELNEGRGNVSFSYIAIGKRKGYENPQLAREVVSGNYVDKMTRGLHNDGNQSTEAEGVYYSNGQLFVGKAPMNPGIQPIATEDDKPNIPDLGNVRAPEPEPAEPVVISPDDSKK